MLLDWQTPELEGILQRSQQRQRDDEELRRRAAQQRALAEAHTAYSPEGRQQRMAMADQAAGPMPEMQQPAPPRAYDESQIQANELVQSMLQRKEPTDVLTRKHDFMRAVATGENPRVIHPRNWLSDTRPGPSPEFDPNMVANARWQFQDAARQRAEDAVGGGRLGFVDRAVGSASSAFADNVAQPAIRAIGQGMGVAALPSLDPMFSPTRPGTSARTMESHPAFESYVPQPALDQVRRVPLFGNPAADVIEGTTSPVGFAGALAFPPSVTAKMGVGSVLTGAAGEALDRAHAPNPLPVSYQTAGELVGAFAGPMAIDRLAASRVGQAAYTELGARVPAVRNRYMQQHGVKPVAGARLYNLPPTDDLLTRAGSYRRAGTDEGVVLMSDALPPSSVINSELRNARMALAANPSGRGVQTLQVRVAQLEAMKEIDDIAAASGSVDAHVQQIQDNFNYLDGLTKELDAAASVKGVSVRAYDLSAEDVGPQAQRAYAQTSYENGPSSVSFEEANRYRAPQNAPVNTSGLTRDQVEAQTQVYHDFLSNHRYEPVDNVVDQAASAPSGTGVTQGGMFGKPAAVVGEHPPVARIVEELHGSSGGQKDLSLTALDAEGKQIGFLNYSTYRPFRYAPEQIHIQGIEVAKDVQRQGVGRALVDDLRQKFPDREFDWGMTTPSGESLRASVDPTGRGMGAPRQPAADVGAGAPPPNKPPTALGGKPLPEDPLAAETAGREVLQVGDTVAPATTGQPLRGTFYRGESDLALPDDLKGAFKTPNPRTATGFAGTGGGARVAREELEFTNPVVFDSRQQAGAKIGGINMASDIATFDRKIARWAKAEGHDAVIYRETNELQDLSRVPQLEHDALVGQKSTIGPNERGYNLHDSGAGAPESVPGAGLSDAPASRVPGGGQAPPGGAGSGTGLGSAPLEPAPRARQILANSEEGLLHPGKGTQVPGVNKLLRYSNPSVNEASMPRNILVAGHAERGAIASVQTEFAQVRRTPVQELEAAWKAEPPQYIGPADNPSWNKSTIKDFADYPEHYAPPSPRLAAARTAYDASSNEAVQIVNDGFGMEVPLYGNEKPDAFYLTTQPARDSAEEIVKREAQTATRGGLSSTPGVGKTRHYEGNYDRWKANPNFRGETDLATLTAYHDQGLASAAGAQTFKIGAAGKTKLEVLTETHPKLAAKMTALREQLASARSSLASVNERAGTAVAKFLKDPESMTLADLQSELDVRIMRGRYAGATPSTLKTQLNDIRQQIRELKPAWDGAQPGDYIRSDATHLYQTPAEVRAISDIKRTKLSAGNQLLDFVDEGRSMAFSGDLSPLVGIQVPLGFMANPVTSGKSAWGMARELGDPGSAWAAEWAKSPETMTQFAEVSGQKVGARGAEFQQAGKGLERAPGIGRLSGEANDRMMSAVSYQVYRNWKTDRAILMAGGRSQAAANAESWNTWSKLVPNLNPAERGLSPLQAKLERVPVVSSSFILGPAGLVKDYTSGLAKLAGHIGGPADRWAALAGREQLALIRGTSMAGSVLILGAASYVANGYTLEEAIKLVTDVNGRRFMSISIPFTDRFIPIGGPFRSLMKAIIPRGIGGSDLAGYVPFQGVPQYLLNKANVVVKLPSDMARNADYYGRSIRKGNLPEQILRTIEYGAESFLPLSAGAVAQGIRTGQSAGDIAQNAGGLFLGTNINEPTTGEKLRDAWKKKNGTDYNPETDYLKAQQDPGLGPMLEQASKDSLAAGRASAVTADENVKYFAQKEQELRLPLLAQGVLSGDSAAGAAFVKAYSDFQQTVGDTFSRQYFGQDPKQYDSPAGKAMQAWQQVSPSADKYFDPETMQTDFAAYFTDKQAAFDAVKQADPALAAALEARTRLSYPQAQQAEQQLRDARKLLDALPPKYEGMTKEEEQQARDFAAEIRRQQPAIEKQAGGAVTDKEIADFLAQEPGQEQPSLAWELKGSADISVDYLNRLLDYQKVIEPLFPNLYRLKDLRDAIASSSTAR